MFHVLLWLSLLASILAILLAFLGLESAGYMLIFPIFALFYSFVISLVKKASSYPKKVVARICATLYVLGFFWLVFSVSVLVLSAVFYQSAISRGMLRLINSIIFFSLIILGLSLLSLIAARKLDRQCR